MSKVPEQTYFELRTNDSYLTDVRPASCRIGAYYIGGWGVSKFLIFFYAPDGANIQTDIRTDIRIDIRTDRRTERLYD